MRIKGLVRISTNVQSQLARGVRPEAASKFREYIRSTINQVEMICASGGISPIELPAPSRNAYLFLKSLNLDNLPINANLKEVPHEKKAYVKNVVRSAGRFSLEMWETLDELIESESARSELRFGLETVTEAIEAVCTDQGTTVHGIPEQSKLSYVWMKFLLKGNNLDAHIEALRIGRYTALEQGLAVEIHLANLAKSLYSIGEKDGRLHIKAHECFIHASPEIWMHLVKLMNDNSRVSHNAVMKFSRDPRCSSTSKELITMMCGCRDRQHGVNDAH